MKSIIDENITRIKKIQSLYNPITGEGSPIPRKKVYIPDSPLSELWLPEQMLKDHAVKTVIKKGFYALMREGKYPINDTYLNIFWEDFCRIRIRYDFEFFARMCQTIQDKSTHKDTPFILNRAQRKYLTYLEELRSSGRPIDIILCKARQWGGSTLTQLYMLWLQICITPGANSIICGDVENQSRVVAGMLSRCIERMPYWVTGLTFKSAPYQGASSTREIQPIGSRYTIGSAQKPDKVRSENISLAHLTEVGLWKATKSKSPEDLVQSIFGSCLSGPGTMKVIESTAKGVGNYFHRTWIEATEGRNNFTPVFIPWFDIDLYSKPIKEKDYSCFIDSMNEDEKRLFSLGATLEAINWYRDKKKEITEEWRLSSEFPSTAAEAFQSTGHRVFKLNYVYEARKSACPAWWNGDVVGDKLQNIRLEKGDGNLCIWYMPGEELYRNRYIVTVDVGGVSDKADYSCIIVLDRLAMLSGGVPEVCAVWHGHIEHDRLAWKAAQLAWIYNNALLVIEANTMETEGTEGDNFEYILNEIAGTYSNLYCRTSEQEIRQGRPRRWGFHTNTSTKPMVIGFLNKALRDGLYIEHDARTCDELDLFERKENGKEMGAVEGNHDDRVMATAIGVWVCYNTPLPNEIKQKSMTRKTRIVSEASI